MISFSVLSVLGYGFIAFANFTGYNPGETLDPTCTPGSSHCTVNQLGLNGIPSDSILYSNGSGGIGYDGAFIRNVSTKNTLIATPMSGNYQGGFSTDSGSNYIGTGITDTVTNEFANSETLVGFGGLLETGLTYEKPASNIASSIKLNQNGNILKWDADTTDGISTSLEQSQNILGLGQSSGTALTWQDSVTGINALVGAGDGSQGTGSPGDTNMVTINTNTGDAASFSTSYDTNNTTMVLSALANNGTNSGGFTANKSFSELFFSADNLATYSFVQSNTFKAGFGKFDGTYQWSSALEDGRFLFSNDTTNKNYLNLDAGNGLYQIGDIDNGSHHTFIGVDDTSKAITFNYNIGSYTFPVGNGTGVLTNDGSGILTWTPAPSSVGDDCGSKTCFSTSTGGNMFAGTSSGTSLTTGYGNLFIGSGTGSQTSTTAYNTFVGNGSGALNTGGFQNAFFGFSAGAYNTDGINNTLVGSAAGYSNTNGSANVFVGQNAGLFVNSSNQVGIGTETLRGDPFGSNNTGIQNTAVGYQAGYSNTSGANNFFGGFQAGYHNTEGSQNVALGFQALFKDTTGYLNVAIGPNAMHDNTIGFGNSAIGVSALTSNTEGIYNIAEGYQAMGSNLTGSDNVAIGHNVLPSNITGYNNIAIGLGADVATSSTNNAIALGTNAIAATGQFALSDSMDGLKLRGISYIMPASQASATQTYLYNDTAGNLSWEDPALTPSDQRLKSHITDLDTNILSKIEQLRTVTYTLNSDSSHRTQVGFIAQNMQDLFPELVGDRSDGYLGVYYSQVTPILVEGIKELNLKITNIESIATMQNQGFKDSLIAWLGDETNGVMDFFANRGMFKQEVCVDGECLTKEDIHNLLQTVHDNNPAPVVDDQHDSGSDTTPPTSDNPAPTLDPQSDPTPAPEVSPDSDSGADQGSDTPLAPDPQPESNPISIQ